MDIRKLNTFHLICFAVFSNLASLDLLSARETSKENNPSIAHLDRLSFYVIPVDDSSKNLDRLLDLSQDKSKQISVWKKLNQPNDIHFSVMKLTSDKDFVNLKNEGMEADFFSLPDENLEVLASLVSLKKSTIDLSQTVARIKAQDWMLGSVGLIPITAIPAYHIYEEGSKYLASFFLVLPVPFIAHSLRLRLEAYPDSWLSKKIFRTESKTMNSLNSVLLAKRNNENVITILVSADENKIRWLETAFGKNPSFSKVSK